MLITLLPLNEMDCCVRFYVLTRFKCGFPANSIQSELLAVHGDAKPCLRTIQRWVESMKSGSFQPQKKLGHGRLVTSVTHEKIKEIEARIGQNCRLSCYDVALDIYLDKSAVHRVLTDVLGLINLCSCGYPTNCHIRIKCSELSVQIGF